MEQSKTYEIKKGIIHAMIVLLVGIIGSSYAFTWKIAQGVNSIENLINSHIENKYIHDADQNHVTKELLILYLEPMKQQLDRIEEKVDKQEPDD